MVCCVEVETTSNFFPMESFRRGKQRTADDGSSSADNQEGSQTGITRRLEIQGFSNPHGIPLNRLNGVRLVYGDRRPILQGIYRYPPSSEGWAGVQRRHSSDDTGRCPRPERWGITFGKQDDITPIPVHELARKNPPLSRKSTESESVIAEACSKHS